ncbi:carbohydrate binding domain-containing protein [Novilysobacter arseniciresistens]|uniref:carbohydrate binding domain-containing protein n=1 Tax=Novilysobacter arseniciresistens TaxID=1385522 RepID=UPI000691B3F4|nr:carbohydrate binding domain-containing protein [Lysobacter arseniciresistens]
MDSPSNTGPRKHRLATLALALAGTVAAGQAAAENVVDIMYVYTPEAAQYGGDIETRLNQYIAQSNQAYQTSNVDIRLRLVHSVQSSNSNYRYTGNTALNYITYNDGAIHALRDDHGADFVGLLNMAPGGLCGVGWLGQSSGGVITTTSKNMAYSSSAIDCGYLTFTHELGHNMGLMHSRRQGDTSGGHHVYGMGYGVDYSFATLMAYAYLFNTNYVYRFSNPRQTCNGTACGDASTADSARSLGLMANQYPDYRPSRTDPDPGPEPDPELPVPPQGSNMIANPSFEDGLGGWAGAHGGSLSLSGTRRHGGKQGVAVSNRGSYAAGFAQDITGKLQTGTDYTFGLWMRLQGKSSDTARVVLEVNGGESYVDLGRFGVTDAWTEIDGEFTHQVPAGSRVRLLVYGPAAGVNFHADSISIAPVDGGDDSGNLVRNGDFEGGTAASWARTFGGTLGVVGDGFNSSRSLRLSNRTSWYDGVGQELVGLEAGSDYVASARVKVSGRNDPTSLWVLIHDDSGRYWQRVAWAAADNGDWTELTGKFRIEPVGTLYSVALHVMGPNAGVDFQVDDISVVPI